jgi:hypothetical protein
MSASPVDSRPGSRSFHDSESYTATMYARFHCARSIAAIAGPIALLILSTPACERAAEPTPTPESTAPSTPAATTQTTVVAPPTIVEGSDDGDQLDIMAGSVPFRVTPASIDFGAVEPGSVNEATFTIANRGDRSVRVVRATPSCVCTTLTDLTGVAIAPGESVELRASLDAPTVAGEKDAKVFLVLEGMDSPAILKLLGMVTLPVQPTPAYADALRGVTSGVIGLASVDGRPFRVLASNGEAPESVGAAKGASSASHAVRWSIEGLEPDRIPKWWIYSTDRVDCPLVACRVRNENTGSKRDPGRFDRRWVPKDDFVPLGRVSVGEPIDVPIRLTHYNPRGQGAIDKPAWSRVLGARCVDPHLDVSLVSAAADGQDAVDLVVRLVPTGPPTSLLYVPIEIETATGTGAVEIAAMVVEK